MQKVHLSCLIHPLYFFFLQSVLITILFGLNDFILYNVSVFGILPYIYTSIPINLYPLNKIQRRCMYVCVYVCVFVRQISRERVDGFQKFFLLYVGIHLEWVQFDFHVLRLRGRGTLLFFLIFAIWL